MLNGILVIRKEQDYTSNDVVAKLRGICRQKKIGHTGTLDPNATGVLPVCLGNATKLCDMLTDRSKEYIAELTLGITTDTQDLTGKALSQTEVFSDRQEAERAILGFAGEQLGRFLSGKTAADTAHVLGAEGKRKTPLRTGACRHRDREESTRDRNRRDRIAAAGRMP